MTRDLFGYEELLDLYVVQRLSLRAIGELKGCHTETVRKYLMLYGVGRRSVSEARIKHSRTSFSNDPIERAYMLGFRAGDLYVQRANNSATSQTIIVACTSTVPEQIDLVRELFCTYGGFSLSAGARQSVITFYLDLSFAFLLPKEDILPDWLGQNRSYFLAYFAGYTDAEGSIKIKRSTNAAECVIRSYDHNILQSLWAGLQELGVVCPQVHRTKAKGERDGSGPVYHGDYWGLGIYRRDSLLRLFNLIEPYLRHPLRRRDMLLAWDNVKARLNPERTVECLTNLPTS